jgi:hypothetical protein
MGIRDWQSERAAAFASASTNPQSRISNPGYKATHNDTPASNAPMPVAASTSLG